MRIVLIFAALFSALMATAAQAGTDSDWVRDGLRSGAGGHLQLRVAMSAGCKVRPARLHEHLLMSLGPRAAQAPEKQPLVTRYVLVKIRCYPGTNAQAGWHRVSARIGQHQGQLSAVQRLPSERFGRGSAQRLLADASAVMRLALLEADA